MSAEALPAFADCSVKQLVLERAGSKRLLNLGINTFIDARHRDQYGRLDLLHILCELCNRACVGDAGTGSNGQVVARSSLESV
ncbi:hypothetical protein SDC9_155168 [bioreactor metagenome]|uniref:Uncharacterized protein n=1 Tax=bioreactor metagenome TaxID=1076179 RepID=A0A645F2P3_9ZZZZ